MGRINHVDPLGITNLRIRGMWQIQNPRKAFAYLHPNTENKFELICIIPLSKYKSFPENYRKKIESLNINGFKMFNNKVKDPNNPAKLIDCILITFII